MTDPLILRDVRIALDGRELLAVDATVQPGNVLTIMGPSGSGKSTLLAFIGGFLDRAFDASGRVLCGEMDITDWPAEKRRAGLLFQDPLLFPHMSVGGNLMFALPQDVKPTSDRRLRVEAVLDDIGLPDTFDRDPDTLSGGQKARVALARTLLSAPAFLLLDEPFSKLDATLRGQMRDLVFDSAFRSELAVILVTHDVDDAKAAGGQTIIIEERVSDG